MLRIGLSGWIIQDGNYGDFSVGCEYRFALEFYSDALNQSPAAEPGLSPLEQDYYQGVGVVLHRSESSWVVDFGVPAYSQGKAPAWATVGTSCSGRVSIGIDPFFYRDDLVKEEGMPDIFRSWRVQRILLETTPMIDSVDEFGRPLSIRDPLRIGYVETKATDAWNDDHGNASYVLECELL